MSRKIRQKFSPQEYVRLEGVDQNVPFRLSMKLGLWIIVLACLDLEQKSPFLDGHSLCSFSWK